MAHSAEFREFLIDHFSGLGPIEVKRMFGGAGLYVDDACFAIVLFGETLMLRGDDTLGAELEAEGAERWVYSHKTRGDVVMPYWTLPEAAMDDPDEAVAWARKALIPAQEAAAKKRAAKERKAAREKSKQTG